MQEEHSKPTDFSHATLACPPHTSEIELPQEPEGKGNRKSLAWLLKIGQV